MKARLAEEKDIQEILILYRSLFDYMSELEPYFFKKANQDVNFIKAIIKEENADIILVVEEEEILGLALVQIQSNPPYNLFKRHKFAYLMDLVTKVGKRGNGIGSKLIVECELWAKEKEVDYLELSVLNKNINAYNLYLKKGFNEKMTSMYKIIK